MKERIVDKQELSTKNGKEIFADSGEALLWSKSSLMVSVEAVRDQG